MSYLSSSFFYKDTPGAMDSVDLYTEENIKVKKNFNEGFLKRIFKTICLILINI